MIRRLLAITLFAVAGTCSHAQTSLPSSFQAKTIHSPEASDIFVRWGGKGPVFPSRRRLRNSRNEHAADLLGPVGTRR
jgi:hypothetical protein